MSDKQEIHIGDRFAVRCIDVSFEGKGVVFVADNAIFVNSMLPGDYGQIEVMYRRNGAYFANLVSLSKPSSDRIKPLCPIHSACGGCVFQCLSYDKEKEIKKKLVESQLRRASILTSVNDTIGMEEPFWYRNKVQVPFANGPKGELLYGFYREGSHHIIPFEACWINNQKANEILKKLTFILNKYRIAAYEEKTKRGILRHALVRAATNFSEAMVVLVVVQDDLSENQLLIDEIKKEVPEISSLYININAKDTNVILGADFKHIYGSMTIKEKLGDLVFEISPDSFFQVNSKMAEIVYKTAMDLANIQPNDTVLDAYSGTGTIGIFAANRGAKMVTAVEIVKAAVENARYNAMINGVTNYHAVAGDATEFIENEARNGHKYDVIFTDPPRKGCSGEFLRALMKIKANKVVYISCNPVSLARDLCFLTNGYEIKTIQPIDQFPRTIHVESVVSLKLKET